MHGLQQSTSLAPINRPRMAELGVFAARRQEDTTRESGFAYTHSYHTKGTVLPVSVVPGLDIIRKVQ